MRKPDLCCWLCNAPVTHDAPLTGAVCAECAVALAKPDTRSTREHSSEAGVRSEVWSDPRAGR